MELAQFCATSRVVIVAGKGGVGKTLVTATLATAAARTGQSVLVVEVEGKSGLGDLLGTGPLDHDGVDAGAGVQVRAVRADRAMHEYLAARGLERFSDRLTRSGAAEVVATAVPGMKDVLVLGKIKQLEKSGVADLVVVDAPAAGHTVPFLGSAAGLVDAVRIGPLRTQAEEVVELLTDPARCQVVLVTRAEETPVNETVDTAYTLEDRIGIKLGPVVVNAVTPELPRLSTTARFTFDEAEAVRAMREYLGARFAGEQAQLDRLAQLLPLPQLRLPFVPEPIGPRMIERLADELVDEVARLAESRS